MDNIDIKFNLPVSIIKEGKQYIAYTPALDLSSCGKTSKIARSRFEEAVEIFFDELIKKGLLEKALLDLGWKKIKAQWAPPTLVSTKMQSFCVSA